MGQYAILATPMDYKKHIIPSPFDAELRWGWERQSAYDAVLANHAASIAIGGNKSITLVQEFCREHAVLELIPSASYWDDLQTWYHVGRHPRFSVTGALQKAGFQYWESHDTRTEASVRTALAACCEAPDPEADFLERIKPITPAWLYHQRRRYRVSAAFKEKFRQSAFTAEDYWAERSQQRRRLILGHGVAVNDILSGLTLLREDREGQLLVHSSNGLNALYLHVKCPSTGQDYLLSVPPQFAREGATPSDARRWTFGLPADAVFVQEA